MPYAIEGLEETLRALRKFSPELYKEMNAEIKPELKAISTKAKDKFLPKIAGLSNFGVYQTKSGKPSVRKFPIYSVEDARRGITFSIGKIKKNPYGWTNRYLIWNKNAAGVVIEWAGRVHTEGRIGNKASQHFIQNVRSQGQMKQVGRKSGRVIFAAVEENQGKAKRAIEQAVEKAVIRFNAGSIK